MRLHIYIIHSNDDKSVKATNEIIYVPGGGGGVRLPLPHLYNPDCFPSFGTADAARCSCGPPL